MAYPVMPTQCKTCVFLPGNLMNLRSGRLGEIQGYLIGGTNHTCHNAPDRGPLKGAACRGGRDFQLTIWHRLGILDEPTDAGLARAEDAHLESQPPHDEDRPVR